MQEKLKFAAMTHEGLVRTHNEDNHAIIKSEEPRPIAFIIADGMGGHQHGELASQIAVDYVSDCLISELPKLDDSADLDSFLSDIIQKANVKVYLASLENKLNQGMGTTLTIAVFLKEEVWIVHIGDTRIYLLRNDAMEQITVDHTLVQEMVTAGTISVEEARYHPKKNILTQALGVADYLAPQIIHLPYKKNDVFIMCSDGLYGVVTEEEIFGIVKEFKVPEDISRALIERTLEEGAPDNVTAILIKV